MMDKTAEIKAAIRAGELVLGIELGSTRIKAVLIGRDHKPLASGSHSWENQLVDGIWTYALSDVWAGVQDAYKKLTEEVFKRYGEPLRTLRAMGVSAMMHGYLVFDKDGGILTPFRTWRNTITQEASERLTERFQYPIPQRWSIAHLYQAILNGEAHVPKIDYMTTLEGYVHWKLTGERVLGIGDVAGMFPVNADGSDFDARAIEQFDALVAERHYPWKLRDILPKALRAGEAAGVLTEAGARLLDPSGVLQAGVPLCPPEGDAGTGMVATNSVAVRTGNVSAGTSVFAMIVLEHSLKKLHPELDLVTTPSGELVAMAHCNNCTSELNSWVRMFGEFATLFGTKLDDEALYGRLYRYAMTGDADCGGLFACNYYSGEPVTGFSEGRPLLARKPEQPLSLANVMRAQLYASLATLKLGLDILLHEEGVKLDQLTGHGGFFQTQDVGLRVMSAAVGAPVSVLETAGWGGAWGIALLAAYMDEKEAGETLADYLAGRIFAQEKTVRMEPLTEDVAGFARFMEVYKKGLLVEHTAIEALN